MRCRNIVSKLQGTGFPFSASPPPSKNELLALVPKKRALVDMLIDTYFNNYDSIIRI